jgi:MFS family permease
MVADLNVADTAACRASRKAARRLIPFLILCFLIAYLDRVNVAVAALTMNKELGLTAEMFGFGVGIFFFGYFIFEVPSNLILERVGARLWIARIMISWGVISASFAFVPSISAILQSLGFSFFDKPAPFISCVLYSVQQRRASVRVSCFISPTGSPPMRELAGSACGSQGTR